MPNPSVPEMGASRAGLRVLAPGPHFSGLLCSRGSQTYLQSLGVQGVSQPSPVGLGMGGGPWGTGSPRLQVSHDTAGHIGAEPGKTPSPPPPPPPLERLLLTFGLICMWVGGWKRWQQLNQF